MRAEALLDVDKGNVSHGSFFSKPLQPLTEPMKLPLEIQR